jgi:hypothetical protein
MPREQIRAPEHDRNRSLGWLAVDWIEHFCVHGPGDVEGDRVVLDDEWAGFVVDAYAAGKRGGRLYDSAFLSRAKGRAKSELAGFLVLFETFGPCRFERFAKGGEVYRWRGFEHKFERGEPIGRPVTYPFVRCLATEETQAGNTYDNVFYNLTEGPLGEGLPRDAAGITRTILPHGGEIRPSTASNASKDGGKETFVVFDETHLYTLPALVAMYATVRRNGVKRKAASPWSLETSTMYLPGEESVAEATHAFAKQIREGKVRRPRLLFDHREGFPDTDLTNEVELRASLAETYGPFAEVMDLERIIAEIWDPRNAPADSRRYFLNQPTSALDAWITANEWKSVQADKTLAPKTAITLGFDGSRKRARGVTDATALIGCRVSDGHIFELAVWEQPDGPAGEGWEVPKALVLAAVDEAFRLYNVVGFFADPAKWETTVSAWEAKYGGRLKLKATRDHPIEWWMTGGRARHIVQALDEFHTAIVQGEITHDGGYALTRHVLNARRRPTPQGLQIAKANPDSPNKIDAAVAAVLALKARREAIAKGLGGRGKSRKLRRF